MYLYSFTHRDYQQLCGILSFSSAQQCGITSGQMKVYPRHQKQYQSLFHVNCTTLAVWLHAQPSDGQTSSKKARHTWRMSLFALRLQQQLILDRRGPEFLSNSPQINLLQIFLQALIPALLARFGRLASETEPIYSFRNQNRLS